MSPELDGWTEATSTLLKLQPIIKYGDPPDSRAGRSGP
jgi:hypothetical protein